MKKNNKSRKGFTIVELVIVIAVIAILAGVLIPTFSGVVTKAQESAELQKVTNAYKESLITVLADGVVGDGESPYQYKEGETVVYSFTIDADGELTAVADTTDFTYEVANGVVTAANKKLS